MNKKSQDKKTDFIIATNGFINDNNGFTEIVGDKSLSILKCIEAFNKKHSK